MTPPAHPRANDQPGRVLIAKPGLDGHERGARMVVLALQDAGMDVTYTGIRQSPEAIAEAAERCGAEVVGLSILSGAHMELLPRVMDALHQRGMDLIPIMAGGTIPESDRQRLLEIGIAAIFGPGARTAEIAQRVRELIAIRRQHRAPGAHGEGGL